MSYVQTVIWGLVVGLAEILPISGSAHIAFLEKLFGLQGAGQTHRLFYGLLDLALLAAILLMYRLEMASLLRAVHSLFGKQSPRSRRSTDRSEQRLVLLVVVGLLPLVLELLLQRWTTGLYTKPLFWAAMLALGGLVLFLCEYLSRGTKDEKQLRLADALAVGFAQAIAVLPGLSRTGLMLSVGYRRGFQPAFALRYAFLLSVPFLFGSGVIKIIQALTVGVQVSCLPAYFVGMAACMIAALGGLYILQDVLNRKRLSLFAFYSWAAAVFALFLFLIT